MSKGYAPKFYALYTAVILDAIKRKVLSSCQRRIVQYKSTVRDATAEAVSKFAETKQNFYTFDCQFIVQHWS